MRTHSLCLAFVAVASTVGGCTISSSDTGTGRLVAHWTVVGTFDPAQCAAHGAVNARIDVVDSGGVKRNADDTATCASLGATLNDDFPGGTYTVQTTLLGADGNPVTTMASVGVTIPTDGSTVSTSTDFPANSFLGTTTGTGHLEVDWTIAATADPTLCGTHNVASARVDVLDSTSTKVNGGADTQTCTALATSFSQSFTSGNYTVQVTLLAADGTARTTTASGATTIPSDGSTVKVAVDFPESSFF